MADEKKEASQESSSSGGKLAFLENKAILLGVIVVVQALLAIGLTQFLIVPKLGIQGADMSQATSEEVKPEIPEMGVLVGLEEIIVTLQSSGSKPRYLRINVDVEVKDAMVAQVVSSRLPQLRDEVIMTLSDKTAEELSTPAGKKGLRDEIFRKIAEKMPEGVADERVLLRSRGSITGKRARRGTG